MGPRSIVNYVFIVVLAALAADMLSTLLDPRLRDGGRP